MDKKPHSWTNYSRSIYRLQVTQKPFCAFPWFHQQTLPDGSMQPCCLWYRPIAGYDHKNFLHGQFMQDLRTQFMENTAHECCQHCIRAEEIGGASYRQYGFDLADQLGIVFEEPKLVSQEVNFTSVCNLKCRMCSQERSTSWLADAAAMGQKPLGKLESHWNLDVDVAEETRNLMFLGGEPLLHQDELQHTLRTIRDAGDLARTTVSITTNMTVAFEPGLKSLLAATKHTNIICSIDSYGTLNEYIRSDSNWQDIESNMNDLINMRASNQNIGLKINSVYSIFNYDVLDKIVAWAEQLNVWMQINTCTWPKVLDARNLPWSMRSAIVDRYVTSMAKHQKYQHCYNTVINHLRQNGDLDFRTWQNKFKAYNEFLDSRRGMYLKDYVLSLHELANQP